MAQKKKTSKKTDFKDDLLRVQAEFENYRKRVERDRDEYKARATDTVLLELFPIIDHLSMALTHANPNDELAKGVTLVHEQLLRLLQTHCIEEIATNGTFNPQYHEAISTVDDKPAQTIIQTFQRGFKRGEKILRPARVSVGGKK